MREKRVLIVLVAGDIKQSKDLLSPQNEAKKKNDKIENYLIYPIVFQLKFYYL